MISKSDYECILRNAKIYKANLSKSNVIFIYENRITKKYEYTEVMFLPANFKHLTGVQCFDSNGNPIRANHFLDLAVKNRLNINQCHYKSDGTTQLKLKILSKLMNITSSARMIGDYNNSKLHISADKMCGSTSATLAFTKNNKNKLYPSSALQEDIRNLVNEYHTVIAVYQNKHGKDDFEQCYLSKKYDEVKLNRIIELKINNFIPKTRVDEPN